MNSEDMLKAIGEMIDSKLGEVNSRLDEMDSNFNEIKCELKEIKTEQSSMKEELQNFRKETNERFDTLEEGFDILNTNNANNHVIIKGDIDELDEFIKTQAFEKLLVEYPKQDIITTDLRKLFFAYDLLIYGNLNIV